MIYQRLHVYIQHRPCWELLNSNCMCGNWKILFPYYHSDTKQKGCLVWQCSPAQSALVLMGCSPLTRQDYENQSPSLSGKAEAWLSAYRPVLIRLTQCDNGRIWYTQKSRAWTHCDDSWQAHVALTNWERVYTCVLLPHLDSGVAILPRKQSFGSGDDPFLQQCNTHFDGMVHVPGLQ